LRNRKSARTRSSLLAFGSALNTMKPERVRPKHEAARSMRASMAIGILTGTSFRLPSSPGDGSPALAMNAAAR
jgi:hypothetical protein